jgi:F-type H+-transporting ATPase subunit b
MKLPRTFLLAVAVTLLPALGGARVLAQTHPAPVEAAQSGAGHPETPEAQGHGAPEGEGHEAAHAEGHGAHHPEVKLFGHSLGSGAQFGVMLFNFVLFAGILVALLKGALASAFKARAKELEDKLSQAEREKAEADRQIAELESRMAGLQQELEGIMAKAGAEAETEKERILESAKAEAAQILEQTKAEIGAQQRQAEAELRALVADLVVAGAARRLEGRVQGEVAARVLDHAIDQVGGAK